MALLRGDEHRFLVFCDDLSFDGADTSYKSLKAALEGGIEGRPDNVLFYATSNRRHLLPREMMENERSTRDQSRRGGGGEGLALRPLRPLARLPSLQPGRISRNGVRLRRPLRAGGAARRDRARRAGMGDDARLALRAHGLAVHAGSGGAARAGGSRREAFHMTHKLKYGRKRSRPLTGLHPLGANFCKLFVKFPSRKWLFLSSFSKYFLGGF